jgi:hypothetical protein
MMSGALEQPTETRIHTAIQDRLKQYKIHVYCTLITKTSCCNLFNDLMLELSSF